MINSKKAVAMLLVLAMVLAFSVAVAAPSPEVKGDVEELITEVEIEAEDTKATGRIVIDFVIEDETELETADKLVEDAAEALAAAELAEDLELFFVADVYAVDENGIKVEVDGKVTIEMAVKGIEKGMEVAVLELIDGEWITVNSSINDEGKVVVELEQLGVIAVFAK